MERWLVSVVGEPFDLEELPLWFPSGDIYALAEGQSVFLTGPTLESIREPAEVLDVAAQALDELCAILALLWPQFNAPSVGVVFREDAAGARTSNTIVRLELGAMRLK